MVVERALALNLETHTCTHTSGHLWGTILICIKHGKRAGAGGVREIGRTSANGQKAYGNDPDNERRPQGVESQGESEGVRKGVSVNVIN